MNLKNCSHFNRRLAEECKAIGLTKRDIKELDISNEIIDTSSCFDGGMRTCDVGATHVAVTMKDGREIRFYYHKRTYTKREV